MAASFRAFSIDTGVEPPLIVATFRLPDSVDVSVNLEMALVPAAAHGWMIRPRIDEFQLGEAPSGYEVIRDNDLFNWCMGPMKATMDRMLARRYGQTFTVRDIQAADRALQFNVEHAPR